MKDHEVIILFDKKKIIPILISAVLCSLMVAVSDITGDTDIIFPEICAVALGALAAPVRSWNTSKLRLLILMTASALLGMAVVRFVPVPMYIRIPIGLAAVMTLITISQTDFLPAISACILPIMNSTHHFTYPLSVFILTGLILSAQHILEKTGMRSKHRYVPIEPDKALITLRIKQVITIGIVCFLPVILGKPFFIMPPLMVAYAEMSTPGSPIKKNMTTATAMMALCTFIGCSSRILLCEISGLPMAAAAGITCCAVLLAVDKTEFYFPPCGAISMLPFMIPQHTLIRFPFLVTVGFMIFALISLLSSNNLSREKKSCTDERAERTEAIENI